MTVERLQANLSLTDTQGRLTPYALEVFEKWARAIDANASGGGGGGGFSGAYGDLTGVPGTFAPSAHTHPISEVTNLQTELNGKAGTSHSHVIADTTGLQTALDGKQAAGSYAASSHTHVIADVTSLQTELDGKATSSHTHTEADITDLGAYLLDAPSDGTQYARQDGAWAAVAGGGGGTSVEVFSVTKNGNQDLTGNSYQDVTGWDSPTLNQMSATFNATTGEWTAPSTGVYMISYDGTLDQYSGNNRDSAYMRAVLDGTLIKGSEKIGYHRQNTHGFNSYAWSRTINITASQVVKIQARNFSTSRLHRVLADSATWEIWKIG